ncbi:hypothetical protein OV079_16150 [Nannocystis pusilla]|uniref:Uncharacterized protein n=1 Tax=Nannocystis pusilla TaxID=889268 RepID=A0A9X3IX38_9BACT|nr:hypothetical protein [Nannocystis pusilla]MCY1007061.1 hypothetical protein [Nannocystis pusilla]
MPHDEQLLVLVLVEKPQSCGGDLDARDPIRTGLVGCQALDVRQQDLAVLEEREPRDLEDVQLGRCTTIRVSAPVSRGNKSSEPSRRARTLIVRAVIV